MEFKNYELQPLIQLLFNIKLKGKESRMRTRLIDLLEHHLTGVVAKEEIALIEEYSLRNPDGSIKVDKNNPNLPCFLEGKEVEFSREHSELLSESFFIEENESNRMMILSVSNTMLNGDFEVSGAVAVLYDKWCDQFEKVKENYEKYTESEN